MRNTPAGHWLLGALLALSALACGPSQEPPPPLDEAPPAGEDMLSREPLTSQWKHSEDEDVLVPTSDVASDDVTGEPDHRRLYRNIDDGTDDDGNDSYVTLEKGRRAGDFTVGFSGGPEGTVKEVELHYQAKRKDSRGRAWVELYDGTRLLGRGGTKTLSSEWKGYTDRFTGLSVARASDLRARVYLEATSGRGGLRVTSLWLRVKVEPTPPGPVGGVRRVDAFLFRDVSTCVIGNPCTDTSCFVLSDSTGTARVRFAFDAALRSVPPTDPAVGSAALAQCLHLRLSDAEVAARRAELERYRDDVALWTGGDLTLDLRIHDIAETTELSESPYNGGMWIAPWDARPIIFPLLTRETDFVLVTPGVRDPELDLHHELPACGLTYGADYGVGGAGFSWIPDSASSFWFQCADHGVYTHEWLHQLKFAVDVLSSFDELYRGSYPACGEADPDTHRWFPDTHECAVDPDSPFCTTGNCVSNDAVNEHVLRAHWPPRPLPRLVTNYCRDDVRDYDETAVDVGPNCPGTLRAVPRLPPPAAPPVPVSEPLPSR